ncbi:uncharacterized protein LOC130725376 [Lotus japonicus]|uniref:uncharacterized protein LOC130725376 n=1 Tax=Lotus japonicus TaxID=34305 RepID=UPI0025907E0B|nr:uncharacterized protein LOC130725376 [Lotus japonicus]
MCCKDFLDAAEDGYVWRRVSLDTFPLIQWLPNDKVSSFLNRCKEYGNMESLYREGLQKYFDYPNGKIDGLEIFKVAAQKGHKEAKYVYERNLLAPLSMFGSSSNSEDVADSWVMDKAIAKDRTKRCFFPVWVFFFPFVLPLVHELKYS